MQCVCQEESVQRMMRNLKKFIMNKQFHSQIEFGGDIIKNSQINFNQSLK